METFFGSFFCILYCNVCSTEVLCTVSMQASSTMRKYIQRGTNPESIMPLCTLLSSLMCHLAVIRLHADMQRHQHYVVAEQ